MGWGQTNILKNYCTLKKKNLLVRVRVSACTDSCGPGPRFIKNFFSVKMVFERQNGFSATKTPVNGFQRQDSRFIKIGAVKF